MNQISTSGKVVVTLHDQNSVHDSMNVKGVDAIHVQPTGTVYPYKDSRLIRVEQSCHEPPWPPRPGKLRSMMADTSSEEKSCHDRGRQSPGTPLMERSPNVPENKVMVEVVDAITRNFTEVLSDQAKMNAEVYAGLRSLMKDVVGASQDLGAASLEGAHLQAVMMNAWMSFVARGTESPMDGQEIHEERNQGLPQREQNNEGWDSECFAWVRSQADARCRSVHRENLEGNLDEILASRDEWRSVNSEDVEWGSSVHAEVLPDVEECRPPNSGVVIEELSDTTPTVRSGGVWEESEIKFPQHCENVVPCTLGYSRRVVIEELLCDDSIADDGPRVYCPPENWTDFVGCSQSADKREKPLGELNASLKTGDYSRTLGESSGTFSFQIQSNSIGYSHQEVGFERGKRWSSGDTYLQESRGKDSIDSSMSSSPHLIILLDTIKGHDQSSKNSNIVDGLGNLAKTAFSEGKPQSGDVILPKDCVPSGEPSMKSCISTSTNTEEADGLRILRKITFQEDETQTSDTSLHRESVLSGPPPLKSCTSASTNTEGTEVFGKMKKTASQDDETLTGHEILRKESVLSGTPFLSSWIPTKGVDPDSNSLIDMISQTTPILDQTPIQRCQTDDIPSESTTADETLKLDESHNDINEHYSSDESLHDSTSTSAEQQVDEICCDADVDVDVAILSATMDICASDKDKTPTLTFSDVEVWTSSFGESVCLGESKLVRESPGGSTYTLALDEKHKGNPWRWHLGGPESDPHTARSFGELFHEDEVDRTLVTHPHVSRPLFQELNKETKNPCAGECAEVLVLVSSHDASPRENTECMNETEDGSSTKEHGQMQECRNVRKSKHLKVQDIQEAEGFFLCKPSTKSAIDTWLAVTKIQMKAKKRKSGPKWRQFFDAVLEKFTRRMPAAALKIQSFFKGFQCRRLVWLQTGWKSKFGARNPHFRCCSKLKRKQPFLLPFVPYGEGSSKSVQGPSAEASTEGTETGEVTSRTSKETVGRNMKVDDVPAGFCVLGVSDVMSYHKVEDDSGKRGEGQIRSNDINGFQNNVNKRNIKGNLNQWVEADCEEAETLHCESDTRQGSIEQEQREDNEMNEVDDRLEGQTFADAKSHNDEWMKNVERLEVEKSNQTGEADRLQFGEGEMKRILKMSYKVKEEVSNSVPCQQGTKTPELVLQSSLGEEEFLATVTRNLKLMRYSYFDTERVLSSGVTDAAGKIGVADIYKSPASGRSRCLSVWQRECVACGPCSILFPEDCVFCNPPKVSRAHNCSKFCLEVTRGLPLSTLVMATVKEMSKRLSELNNSANNLEGELLQIRQGDMISRGRSAIQPFLCTDPVKYQDWKQLHIRRQIKFTHFMWPLQCQKNPGGRSSALDSRAKFKCHLTVQHKRANLLQESGLQNRVDSDKRAPMGEQVITSLTSTRVTKLKGGTHCHHILSSRLYGAAKTPVNRHLESRMNAPVQERLVTPPSTPRASKEKRITSPSSTRTVKGAETHCHHLSTSRLCSSAKPCISRALDRDTDGPKSSNASSPSTRISRIMTSPLACVSKGAGDCHQMTASKLRGAAKSRNSQRLDIHKIESKAPSSPSAGVSMGSSRYHPLFASRLCRAAKSCSSSCLDSDIRKDPEGRSASSPSTCNVSRNFISPYTRISRIINSPLARVGMGASHCHHLTASRPCGAGKARISMRLDNSKDMRNLTSSVSK